MTRTSRATIELAAKDLTRPAFASVTGNFSGLQGQVDNMTRRFAGLQSTVLAALSGFGLGSVITRVADQLDAFNDLRDATGASLQQISRLDLAVRRAGGSFDQVSDLLLKFNTALLQAKPGSDQARAFDALGLSVAQLRAQDPAEALLTTARAFQNYAEDGNAARAQTLLFGESVRTLAPVLKDLAESGDEFSAATVAQAAAADEFNKKLASVRTAAQELTRTAVGEVLPVLNEVLRAFDTGARSAKEFSEGGGLLRTAFEAVAITAANVEFVLSAMGREIGAVAAQLVALGRLDLQGFNAISQAVKEDGARARAELDAFEQRILSVGRTFSGTVQQTSAETARLERMANGIRQSLQLPEVNREPTRKNAGARTKPTDYSELGVGAFADVGFTAQDALDRAYEDARQLEEEAARVARAVREDIERAAASTFEATRTPLERLNIELARQQDLLNALGPSYRDTYERAVFAAQDAFDEASKLADKMKEIDGFARDVGLTFSSAFEDAIVEGKKLRDVLKGIAQDLLRIVIRKQVTEPLGQAITNALPSLFPGGGRASGGTVRRGGLYPVNEYGGAGEILQAGGRQYLLAAQDGYVTPAMSRMPAIAGGAGLEVNVTVQTERGQSAVVEQRRTANGVDLLVRMVRDTVNNDVANGGPISRQLAGTFGLSRVAGAPRRG